jgi:hypothetical protein
VRFEVIFGCRHDLKGIVYEDQSGDIGLGALCARQPNLCSKLCRRTKKQIERGRRPGETNFPGRAGEQNRGSPRFCTVDFGHVAPESGCHAAEGDCCTAEANLFRWTMRRKVASRRRQ